MWPRAARHIWGAIGLTCWLVAAWNLSNIIFPHSHDLSNFWYFCITNLICWAVAVVTLEAGTLLWRRLEKVWDYWPEDKTSCW